MTVTTLNQGFVFREDYALHTRLTQVPNVPVSMKMRAEDPQLGVDADHDDGSLIDDKTMRVGVFFRLPENELRRKRYPYITIDFLTAVRDVEREHRGVVDFGLADDPNAYVPDGMPADGGRVEMPIPMQLHYQVTTFARFSLHDRLINQWLITNVLEPRFGYLEMVGSAEAPDDHTIRRMDLLAGPNNGDTRDGKGKRVFRKMYTVSVASELFHSDFVAMTPPVGTVDIDVSPLE
jgi:hypothetical protein